jgi:hypothetical protein
MNPFFIPEVWQTQRDSLISFWRAWNSTLDVVFYDVNALLADERATLSAHANPEGSVLIVYPCESQQPIRNLTPWNFVQEQNQEIGEGVAAIVVAGVGSSAVGTATLARNVADYLRRPVAGVISGFGIADVLTEALGGWFVLGTANTLRNFLARLFDTMEFKDHVRDPETHRAIIEHFESASLEKESFIYGSPDSTTLLYLLSKLGPKIKLLVGHSKGNYSIENALEGLLETCHQTGMPIPSGIHIITLGAVIQFPPEFTKIHQFIGQIDYFGMLNSRPAVDRVIMPGAWHTLNTFKLGHLSVRQALQIADVH